MRRSIVGIDKLRNKIESQLGSGIKDSSVNQTLIEEAKIFMNRNPESRTKLGPLIGKLKSISKQNHDVDLNWVELLNGYIAIGHRPKVKMLKNMKGSGTTHIFTLLSEREGAKDIGRAAEKHGLNWLWMPLHSAKPPEQDRFQEIDDVFRTCVNDLKNGAKIYIHCSAGIHRTGMVSYALFRYIGFDSAKSASLLYELRDVTGKEVGDHRKLWGDKYCNHLTRNCKTFRQEHT